MEAMKLHGQLTLTAKHRTKKISTQAATIKYLRDTITTIQPDLFDGDSIEDPSGVYNKSIDTSTKPNVSQA